VAEAASPLLRVRVKNYMVHVNADDGSHVFMPYVGGLANYTRRGDQVAANGYEGFALKRVARKGVTSTASSKTTTEIMRQKQPYNSGGD
jgi:hypothetical protein